LCHTYGKQQGEDILITKKFTNSELADMIGATRESVNRMLADLKKGGIVSNQQQHLVIKKLDHLKSICQCENCPKDMCRI
jgi:CRP-like cAMP-binding protein